MINNQEGSIVHNGLSCHKGTWVECQHYLVMQEHPPASTFIDLDRLGKGTRDLDEDYKKCGGPSRKERGKRGFFALEKKKQ